MPCPPPPERIEMLRLDSEDEEVRRFVREINTQIIPVIELGEKLLEHYSSHFDKQTQEMIRKIHYNFYEFEGPDEVKRYNYYPSQFPDFSEIQLFQQQIRFLNDLGKLRQEALTESRIILMKVLLDYPELADGALKDELLREKKIILEYQEEKRKAQLLQWEKELKEAVEKEQIYPERVYYREIQPILKDKMVKLKALTETDLLTRRELW